MEKEGYTLDVWVKDVDGRKIEKEGEIKLNGNYGG
jgi:hypothetical protein